MRVVNVDILLRKLRKVEVIFAVESNGDIVLRCELVREVNDRTRKCRRSRCCANDVTVVYISIDILACFAE